VVATLEQGVDFVTIGRSAILHHDFPIKIMEDFEFEPVKCPVSTEYLTKEGLGPDFIEYMRRWPYFVKSEKAS
ncbi:MAG: NADH:flavin oxidoreductase, partial [Flavobacteriales bacterium]|nr:NADH:flavin oxidoreductase [Flavobacteriales bacterium]